MIKKLHTLGSFTVLFVLASTLWLAKSAKAQTPTDEKVKGVDERVTTLEGTIAGMQKLKITGYVQPQWLWNDADSQYTISNNRSYFTIRRGRVKFTHTSDNISAVIYPDITENGVVMKEVFAT